MAGKCSSVGREYEYLLLAVHKVSSAAMFDLDRHLADWCGCGHRRRLALMSVVSSDVLNQQQGMIEFNVALLRKAILQILEAIGQ